MLDWVVKTEESVYLSLPHGGPSAPSHPCPAGNLWFPGEWPETAARSQGPPPGSDYHPACNLLPCWPPGPLTTRRSGRLQVWVDTGVTWASSLPGPAPALAPLDASVNKTLRETGWARMWQLPLRGGQMLQWRCWLNLLGFLFFFHKRQESISSVSSCFAYTTAPPPLPPPPHPTTHTSVNYPAVGYCRRKNWGPPSAIFSLCSM